MKLYNITYITFEVLFNPINILMNKGKRKRRIVTPIVVLFAELFRRSMDEIFEENKLLCFF